MPNRVDANANVSRPTFGQNEARRANRASENAEQETQTIQRDRVEISAPARLQAEKAQTRVGEANANNRSAAVDAPSARPRPEAGEQGVNRATAQQAEQVRETRQQVERETVREPSEKQGNLIDVLG